MFSRRRMAAVGGVVATVAGLLIAGAVSSSAANAEANYGPYGATQVGKDYPYPLDYNCDDKADIALVHNDGSHLVWKDRDTGTNIVFGVSGDIPAPGYYGEDTPEYGASSGAVVLAPFVGTAPGNCELAGQELQHGGADIAVYRPSNSTFYFYNWNSATTGGTFTYGTTGDRPVPGPWYGIGGNPVDTVALWRPSTEQLFFPKADGTSFVYAYNNTTGSASGTYQVLPWLPVQTQISCSSADEAANHPFCAQSQTAYGEFYSGNTDKPLCAGTQVGTPACRTTGYGSAGDIAFAMNWGEYSLKSTCNVSDQVSSPLETISVWRPSNGTWYLRDYGSSAGNVSTVRQTTQWGQNGDIPVPGNYDGDKTPANCSTVSGGGVTVGSSPWTNLAVFRPSTATWYVKGIETVQFGTPWS